MKAGFLKTAAMGLGILGASVLSLPGPASAATYVNLYGATAQYNFWSNYATTFLGLSSRPPLRHRYRAVRDLRWEELAGDRHQLHGNHRCQSMHLRVGQYFRLNLFHLLQQGLLGRSRCSERLL